MDVPHKSFEIFLGVNCELHKLLVKVVSDISIKNQPDAGPNRTGDAGIALSRILTRMGKKQVSKIVKFSLNYEKIYQNGDEKIGAVVHRVNIEELDNSFLLGLLLWVESFSLDSYATGVCQNGHGSCCVGPNSCNHLLSKCENNCKVHKKVKRNCKLEKHLCHNILCKKDYSECIVCCDVCKMCLQCNEKNYKNMILITVKKYNTINLTQRACKQFLYEKALDLSLKFRNMYSHLTEIELKKFLDQNTPQQLGGLKDIDTMEEMKCLMSEIFTYISEYYKFTDEEKNTFLKKLGIIFDYGKEMYEYFKANSDRLKDINNSMKELKEKLDNEAIKTKENADNQTTELKRHVSIEHEKTRNALEDATSQSIHQVICKQTSDELKIIRSVIEKKFEEIEKFISECVIPLLINRLKEENTKQKMIKFEQVTENGLLVSIPKHLLPSEIKSLYGREKDDHFKKINEYSVDATSSEGVTYLEIMKHTVCEVQVILSLANEEVILESEKIPLSETGDGESLQIKVQYETSLAIDFGTSHCAIAYSYKHEQDVVHCVKDWPDGTTDGKVPTAILFDNDGQFIDFGYGAISKYQNLEEHEYYYFFRGFKMMLYNEKNINKETMLCDLRGRKMRAIDVFIAGIRFLKSHLIKSINEVNTHKQIDEDTIRWVLTVPAIWSNASKQFMREAAEKAGCHPKHLSMALEPEAASIYCRTLSKQKLESDNPFAKANAKYLILDNGGGTLDVTAHQLIENGGIKEVYRATGGAWGGDKVDEIFEEFLEFLFTKENIQDIKKNYANEWMQVIQEFQSMKRKLRSDNLEEYFTFSNLEECPWNESFFKKHSTDVVKGVKLKTLGRLQFPRGVLLEMVKQVSTHVKDHLKGLLQNKELKDLDFIMMVGGFSNSYDLVDDIKELVENNIPIIVPEEVELCVVKGAVLFGWKPDIVRERKSRQTYGLGIRQKFKEGVHDEKRGSYDDYGKKWCKHCFHKLVTINDAIEVNKNVFHHSNSDRKESFIQLYGTEQENPVYCDEEEVFLVGEILIPKPKHARGKNVVTEIYFGDTEIYLKVTDETTNETHGAKFDFLINTF